MTTSRVQLISPDESSGRVVSIYMVAFRGGMTLGSLASGNFADRSSAPTVTRRQRRPAPARDACVLTRPRGVRDL
jgi:hypothetical protein